MMLRNKMLFLDNKKHQEMRQIALYSRDTPFSILLHSGCNLLRPRA